VTLHLPHGASVSYGDECGRTNVIPVGKTPNYSSCLAIFAGSCSRNPGLTIVPRLYLQINSSHISGLCLLHLPESLFFFLWIT